MAQQKSYASILHQILADDSFEKLASFDWNEDTGNVEDGNVPEVAEARGELEDHTGLDRPATKTPSELGKTTVSSDREQSYGPAVHAVPENWRTTRIQKEAGADNDSCLNELSLTDGKANAAGKVENKALSDQEVKGRIDGWFKEAKTIRQVVARLQKMAEQEMFNHGYATQYLKTEAGKMGYEFMEPNSFMDKLPATTTDSFSTVRVSKKLDGIRGDGARRIAAVKTAAGDDLLEVTTLHRMAADVSQSRGLPTMVEAKDADFTVKHVAAMFKQGANLETVFHTGRAKVGAKVAADSVRRFIAALSKSKTAKVKLSQLDCSFLKGKLAAHNAIVGAGKCVSCAYRQGMACGLTGGTLISFPGMQSGIDRNLKIASGAPKDGRAMLADWDLREHAAADIDIKEPDAQEVDMTPAPFDF